MVNNTVAKIMPYNIGAEVALLGGIIQESKNISEVILVVGEGDFYNTSHKKIFKTIVKLYRDDAPIDVVTVCEYLNREGILAEVGGITYISELSSGAIHTNNLVYYGKLINEAAKKRRLIEIGQSIIDKGYDSGVEYKDIVDEACDNLYELSIGNDKSKMYTIGECLDSTLDKMEERYARGGEIPGETTGLSGVDRITGGFQVGNLFVIAGRPAMGKTTFGLNILKGVSKEKKVAVFSFEMAKEQLMERVLSSHCKIRLSNIKECKLKDEDFNALMIGAGELSKSFVHIHDGGSINMNDIRAKCKMLKTKNGLDIILIDYLQLIEPEKNVPREQQVSKISRDLKKLALELDICVVALAQLSRAPEIRTDHRPFLSDLRESGGREQDADIIALLYRDEYYHKDSDEKGVCEVIIAKNRNGETGSVKLNWQPEFQTFSTRENRCYIGTTA